MEGTDADHDFGTLKFLPSEGDGHAHALRHTHAHELFREGVPEKLIQLQLGHARLDSTDMYLRKIGANAAVAVVRARGWQSSGRPDCHGAL